jgi:hypothetical protein
MSKPNEFETTDINDSPFLTMNPEQLSVLKTAPVKTADEPKVSKTPSNTTLLGDAPYVPEGFLLWVDVNMSIKLKTNDHPEGEWITLWCDDEPSPSRSEGKYFFWTWWKSNWNSNKNLLIKKGIPIIESHHYSVAPCDISIPFEYVIEDVYNK